MLEIHKLVPAQVMRYEIGLAEPEKEWRIRNSWIAKQGGVNLRENRSENCRLWRLEK
jgi:hypothetical protein